MKTLDTKNNRFLRLAIICLLMTVYSTSNAQNTLSKSFFLFDSFFQKTEEQTEDQNSEAGHVSSKILIFEESLLTIKQLFSENQDSISVENPVKSNSKIVPKMSKELKNKANNKELGKKKFRNRPGNHEVRI